MQFRTCIHRQRSCKSKDRTVHIPVSGRPISRGGDLFIFALIDFQNRIFFKNSGGIKQDRSACNTGTFHIFIQTEFPVAGKGIFALNNDSAHTSEIGGCILPRCTVVIKGIILQLQHPVCAGSKSIDCTVIPAMFRITRRVVFKQVVFQKQYAVRATGIGIQRPVVGVCIVVAEGAVFDRNICTAEEHCTGFISCIISGECDIVNYMQHSAVCINGTALGCHFVSGCSNKVHIFQIKITIAIVIQIDISAMYIERSAPFCNELISAENITAVVISQQSDPAAGTGHRGGERTAGAVCAVSGFGFGHGSIVRNRQGSAADIGETGSVIAACHTKRSAEHIRIAAVNDPAYTVVAEGEIGIDSRY